MKKSVLASLLQDPLAKRLFDGYLYLVIAFAVVAIAVFVYYQYIGAYKLDF